MLQNWSYKPDLDVERTLDVVSPVFDLLHDFLYDLYDSLDLYNRANLEHLSHWWILEKAELRKMIAQHLNKLCENIWGIVMSSHFFKWHDSFTENVLNPQMSELDVLWLLWNA